MNARTLAAAGLAVRAPAQRTRLFLRSLLLPLALCTLPATVHAATVNLTISQLTLLGAANATRFTPYDYVLTVSNTAAASATNTRLTDTLPAGLANLVAVSVTPLGGAICPTLADLTTALAALPTLTTGTNTVALTVPSLPLVASCAIRFSATPTQPGALRNTVVVAPGPSDTNSAASSQSIITTNVLDSTLDIKVTKTVDASSVTSYPASIDYRIVITGDATRALPVGVPVQTFDAVRDEVGGSAGAIWSTGSYACTSTGFSGGANAGCPSGWSGASGTGLSFVPQTGFAASFDKGLPAGASITLTYRMTIQSVTCNAPVVRNQFQFYVAPMQVISDAPDVLLAQGNGRACRDATPIISVTKTPIGNPKVTAEGGTAAYSVTFNVGGAVDMFPFQVSVIDILKSGSFGNVALTTRISSCSTTGGGVCPVGMTTGTTTSSLVALDPNGNVVFNTSPTFTAPGSITVSYVATYTNVASIACQSAAFAQENFASLRAPANRGVGDPLPISGLYDRWVGGEAQINLSRTNPNPTTDVPAGYIVMDFVAPKCVDVTASATLSVPQPSANVPFTIYLDYVNNSLAATGVANTARNVQVTDVLGANFSPTAVSCAVASGTATPPTPPVSLAANVSGGNNTFNTVIPSMNDGAVVRCAVTGTVAVAGNYTVLLAATANPWTVAGVGDFFDVNLVNNASQQTFALVDPGTISVTKLLGSNPAGYVTGTTFPVTAACTVTPLAPAGPGVVVNVGPVNLVPNVAQSLSVPPSVAGVQTSSCVLSEGAPSAAAWSNYAYLPPGVFNPVNATLVAPVSAGNVSATVTNNLSFTAPPPLSAGFISVTKILGANAAGYVTGTTFPVSAACTVTPLSPPGPAVLVNVGPLNLLPGVAQALSVPPTVAGVQTSSCVLSEGAPSAAAASNYAYLLPAVFSPVSATLTAPAQSGTATATVTNNLSFTPPVAAPPAPSIPVPTSNPFVLLVLSLLVLLLGGCGLYVRRHHF